MGERERERENDLAICAAALKPLEKLRVLLRPLEVLVLVVLQHKSPCHYRELQAGRRTLNHSLGFADDPRRRKGTFRRPHTVGREKYGASGEGGMFWDVSDVAVFLERVQGSIRVLQALPARVWRVQRITPLWVGMRRCGSMM